MFLLTKEGYQEDWRLWADHPATMGNGLLPMIGRNSKAEVKVIGTADSLPLYALIIRLEKIDDMR
jgi:hypothetical protein